MLYNMPSPSNAALGRKTEVQLSLRLPLARLHRLDFPVRGDGLTFSDGFDFAGCVNVTHRAPNQFSYRYGRKIAPPDYALQN